MPVNVHQMLTDRLDQFKAGKRPKADTKNVKKKNMSRLSLATQNSKVMGCS